MAKLRKLRAFTYGAPTKREVEMAELIYELVSRMSVSLVSASDVMSATGVARGWHRKRQDN